MSDEHGDGFAGGRPGHPPQAMPAKRAGHPPKAVPAKRAGSQNLSNGPENDDFPTRVELPDHASAYFSPKPLPATSDHRTLETAAVRLHPSLNFDGADTQRLPVPPFMQDTVDRNAPTVLVRAIAPRRRSRAVFGVVGVGAVCLGGALVWALYGSAPDAAEDAEEAAAASASIPTRSKAPVAKAVSPPSRATGVPEATSGSVASTVTAPSGSPAPSNTTSATTTAPARAKPTARTAPAATAAEEAEPQRETPKVSAPPATTSPEPAPKSWVKDEAPKSWVR